MDMLELEKKYKIGNSILTKLNELNDIELKEKVKSICGNKEELNHFFIPEATVKRIIENETISEISFHYCTSLYINSFKVSFHDSHRAPITLLEFDKHFKL